MKRSKLLGLQIVAATLAMAGPDVITIMGEMPPLCPPIPYQKPRPLGLRERIREATTIQEVEMLRAEGLQYTDASQKTRRAWQTTAKRKLAELALKGVAA
jgi:hypothetical protein